MSIQKIRDIARGTAALPQAYAATKELQRDGYALNTIARRSDVPEELFVGFIGLADGLVNGDFAIVPREVRACEQINHALRRDPADEPEGEPVVR